MKNTRLWALLAIVIGSMALLDKLENLFLVQTYYLENYWPFLLVLVGVLLLFKAPKSLVFLAVLGTIVILTIIPNNRQFRITEMAVDGVEALDVSVTLGAGSLRASGLTTGLYEITTGGRGSRAPVRSYSLVDGIGKLAIGQSRGVSVGGQVHWEMRFSEEVPLRLRVNGGLGHLKLDFRRVRLEELRLAAGAGKVELLVGPSLPTVDIDIAAAAGDLSLTLPRGAKVELISTSPLSKIELSEESAWIRQGNRWSYLGSESAPLINIKVNSAAAKIYVNFS